MLIKVDTRPSGVNGGVLVLPYSKRFSWFRSQVVLFCEQLSLETSTVSCSSSCRLPAVLHPLPARCSMFKMLCLLKNNRSDSGCCLSHCSCASCCQLCSKRKTVLHLVTATCFICDVSQPRARIKETILQWGRFTGFRETAVKSQACPL